MKPVNLMLMSDSPDVSSGLARITRDLALRIYRSNLPVRLAVAGFNGVGGIDLPFFQYQLGSFGTSTDIMKMAPAWEDFTKGEGGILLCIYDLVRLEPFRFGALYGRPWNEFLANSSIHLAGYFPIDSSSPKGMTSQNAEILKAFDTIIAYGKYGQECLKKGTSKEVLSAPHGIDTNVFQPRDRTIGRSRLWREVKSETSPDGKRRIELGDKKLIAVVATNQARKDWGAAFEILAKLGPEYALWGHTDQLMKFWSLPDLAEQFNVTDQVFFTEGNLDDATMAELYSASDVSIGIGSGEGYGYPLVEAMACGTPVVHQDFAGGADLLPEISLVKPLTFRLESPYCLYRPIWDIEAAVARIQHLTHEPKTAFTESMNRNAVLRYDWEKVWPTQWKPIIKKLVDDFKAGGGK